MAIPAPAPWGRFILTMVWLGGQPSRSHENYGELLLTLNARVAAMPQDAAAWRDRALLFLDHAQPEDAAARRERITLLRQMGQPRTALAEADLLLRLPQGQEPDDVLLRLELAAIPPAGHPTAALTWLEQWMIKHPGLMVLEMEALRLELACGRHDSALQRLDRLIGDAPRPEFLLLRKARHLQEWHRLPEAKHVARRCLDAIDALPSHLQFLPVTARTRIAALAILSP